MRMTASNKLKYLTLLVLLLMLFLITAYTRKPKTTKITTRETEAYAKKEVTQPVVRDVKYGINCDDLHVLKDVVQRNQNLTEILLKHNVPYSVINDLALKSKDVFDVRKIKAGNPYCIISDSDSTKKVRYFVYEQNPIDYVVFKLCDSMDVCHGKKAVEIRTRTVSGTIESSLWKTLIEQELDYDLAIKLSELYAWVIDFYHLQKGDGFKVIFEEKFVKDKPIGLGKIKGAKFNHKGKDFYAFYFEQDTDTNYYDEKGNSIRKEFLKAPLKYTRISSGYSKRRLHPILHKYKPHLGIDYAAPIGTPIMSVGDGVILKASYNKNCGKYVKIKHNGTYTTQYLHMSRFATGIRPGVHVNQGDIIGYVGSTGLSTGPHLDFRFCKNGIQVDPLKEDIPSADPVRDDYLKIFNRQMTVLKQKLDTIENRRLSDEPSIS